MSRPLTFNQVMLCIHDVPDGFKVAYMDQLLPNKPRPCIASVSADWFEENAGPAGCTSTPVYAAKSLVVGQSRASWAFGYCGERVANKRQSIATRR